MPDLSPHIYRAGPHEAHLLSDADLKPPEELRRHIEPWLTAVFQSEHLALLLGSGFSTGIALTAGGQPATMSQCEFNCELADQICAYAEESARQMGRGSANIEDQIRAAVQLRDGLRVLRDERTEEVTQALDGVLG